MFLLGLARQLRVVLMRCGGSDIKNTFLWLKDKGLLTLNFDSDDELAPSSLKNLLFTECPSKVTHVTRNPHLSNGKVHSRYKGISWSPVKLVAENLFI